MESPYLYCGIVEVSTFCKVRQQLYLSCRFLASESESNLIHVFRTSGLTWTAVVKCMAPTEETGYFLRVVVQDMAHYSRFVMDTLLKHPSVQDCKTSFVLDRVKATTAVPV